MIIGIDASRANHEQKTGVEWYAFHVIEEMKKIEVKDKVQIILYSDEPLKGELAKLPANWESKVLRWPPKRLWTHVRLSWEMLWHSPDVLFIPAHVFPIIHPKKTVMTVHDVAALRFPESYNWFERWYSVFSAKMALQKLWKIIVPSEFTKSELGNQELGIGNQKDKIFVVPHGYDTRYRKVEDEVQVENILQKYNIQKPFIMSVGRLEEKKNTALIVNAFDQINTVIASEEKQSSHAKIATSPSAPRNDRLQLLLVGRPGHGYEKVKEAIDKSPYKKNIITPGWVDTEDLPLLMNAASVFVFPSLYEGFGLPVLETMACGTPVVASTGNSLEEVGGDAAVYVDPTKSDNIAKAVEMLLANESVRQEKIRLGLERVRMFDWRKCAEKTLQVLVG